MKQFTSREIFGVVIALFIFCTAFVSWRVFFDTISHPDLAHISSALLWFSVMGSVFLLGAVVWQEKWLELAGACVVFLPSFFYIRSFIHSALVICSILLLFLSTRLIQAEIENRIRFHFFRNVRSGSFLFMLGLSLALSSFYFASIEKESWEELVPRFSVGEGAATVVFKTVAYLYPAWKNLADEGMTVDGFLLSLEKDGSMSSSISPQYQNIQRSNGEIPTLLSEYIKRGALQSGDGRVLSQELALQAGREQIALLIGRPVVGDEKIADVFSLAIQYKIITALSGEQATRHFSPIIVPVLLAVLLFLTLIPLGSGISLVWIFLGYLIFRGAVFVGWLKLENLEREQQVLLP